MPTIRVLAVDGGGVRGILPAKVLAWLEGKTGKRCSEMFHFMSGTSNGAVMTSGLAKPNPLSAQELLDIYVTTSGKVFHQSLWRKITTLCGLIGPKYGAAYYESVLQKALGTNTLLSDVRDVELLLTTYDIFGCRPYFFKSWRARGDLSPRARAEARLADGETEDHKTRDFPLWQAARASSAAPSYFPPALPTSLAGTQFPATDGGVFANDPAMCAFAAVLRLYRKEMEAGNLEIQILSIGTGAVDYRYTYDQAKGWGKIGWAVPSLNVMFDGTNQTVDYQLNEIFGGDGCQGNPRAMALPGGLEFKQSSYYRIQADMGLEKDNPAGASSSLDDATPENIEKLLICGDAMIKNNLACLEELARTLSTPRDPISVDAGALELA